MPPDIECSRLMTMLLEVRNIRKVFTTGLVKRKEIVAVNDVSFEVKPREFASLVGESGSGKTTTAKIILKLIKPTSGSITFDGMDVGSMRKLDELRAYWAKVHGIFQDPYASFNPLLKVDRVLNQVLNLMNVPDSDRSNLIRGALGEVGLRPEVILGKYPHELSGGQRQRIMVARCYLLKPKLILADEPISMIDASTRRSVLELFERLREDYGTSVVFITHDLGLAYVVSDRILIMYKGSLVEKGPPQDVMEHPQSDYTRRLREDVPLLYKKWEGF